MITFEEMRIKLFLLNSLLARQNAYLAQSINLKNQLLK